MAKAKIITQNSENILKQIEAMGGNVEKALIKAVNKSGEVATDKYKEVIAEHKQTGITETALKQDFNASSDGRKIVLKTGFKINEGGYPAIYLDRGTPKQKPLNFVRKIKNSAEVKKAVEQTLEEEWRKI